MLKALVLLWVLAVCAYSQQPSPSFPPIGQGQENKASGEKNEKNAGEPNGAATAQQATSPDNPGDFPKGQEAQNQNNSADKWWTDHVTACATIIMAVFTGFLWYSTHKLWQASVAQSQDTKNSIAALNTIAETIQRNAKRQSRAYLSVLTGSYEPQNRDTGFKTQVTMIVKNSGFTPAHAVNFRFVLEVFDSPLRDNINPIPVVHGVPDAAHIAPGNQHGITAIFDRMMPDEEFRDVTEGATRKLYACGRVEYVDIFGDSHFTNFCHMVVRANVENFATLNAHRCNDAN